MTFIHTFMTIDNIMWGWVDGAECPAHIAVRCAADPTPDDDALILSFWLLGLAPSSLGLQQELAS